jgi:hypothetical protein
MAQSGYTPILIYSSTTASNAPSAANLTNSSSGSELAINVTDGKLYYKDNTNAIQVIGSKSAAAGTFSSVTITGGTINGTAIGGSTPAAGAFTTLSSSGLATLNSLSVTGLTGYLYANGASAATASTTIPTTALSGTISNAQLANSSLTIGTTAISLGGTSLTLAGLTSVTVTQDPTSALQLATKQYVDSVAQGLSTKAPVLVATTANITLSGEQTIDGITTSSSRVLVKNQSTPANNGIYVSASGAWSRSSDANTWNQLVSAYVFVEEGTTQADTGWVCTSDPGGTLGVTAVTWVQFSGAGTYTAGTGLTLTGTQFSITNTAVTAGSYTIGNFTVNAQGQLTAASSASTTGSGSVVLATSPTLVTPALGTPSALVGTNITGTAAGLSIGGNAATATTATNATNVAISAGAATTNYITFVTATSGNLPNLINSSLTYNSSTNAITGGIAGGTF